MHIAVRNDCKTSYHQQFLRTGTPASLVPFTRYCPFVYYVIAEPVLLFYKPLPLSCTSRCLGCARLRRRHDQSGQAKMGVRLQYSAMC